MPTPRQVYDFVSNWLSQQPSARKPSRRRRENTSRPGSPSPGVTTRGFNVVTDAPVWLPDGRPAGNIQPTTTAPPPPPPPPPAAGPPTLDTFFRPPPINVPTGIKNHPPASWIVAGSSSPSIATFDLKAQRAAYLQDRTNTAKISPEWTQARGTFVVGTNGHRYSAAATPDGTDPHGVLLYNRYRFQNCRVSCKIYVSTGTSNHMIFFHGSTSAAGVYTGYAAELAAGAVSLYRFDAGTTSLLTDDLATYADGDEFAVHVKNNAFSVLVNGTQLIAASDATYPSGFSGVGSFSTPSQNEEFGNITMDPY